MYSGIEKINEVIEYIESNIVKDLAADTLASKMNLSVYEFRRIFSFVVGTPLSEYIRKRRLSLAACEILTNNSIDRLSLSHKYGRLDILVNNAGGDISIKEVTEFATEKIDSTIKLNLNSVIYGCRALTNMTKEQKSSTMINFAPVYARQC